MDKIDPLVSVFIVTYNSQDYIIEALDSVRSQTYQNIELIVSDDCSTDDTIAKVNEWMNKHQGRFVRTELVKSPVNTGIPANYNRAVKACTGEWLKMMDGDDLITPNCIEDNIKYITNHYDAQIVFSNFVSFRGKKPAFVSSGNISNKANVFFLLSQTEQLKFLLCENFLPSQTCFVKATLLKTNSYDERYRLLEDYPMWLHLLDIGIPFFYFNKITAFYRRGNSVSSNKKYLFTKAYVDTFYSYFQKDMMPLIRRYKHNKAYDYHKKYYTWYKVCIKYFMNKRNIVTVPLAFVLKIIIFHFMHFKL